MNLEEDSYGMEPSLDEDFPPSKIVVIVSNKKRRSTIRCLASILKGFEGFNCLDFSRTLVSLCTQELLDSVEKASLSGSHLPRNYVITSESRCHVADLLE